MKTSLTKLKSSFLIVVISFVTEAWSKPVAQVTEVKGQVFVVSADGKTKTVKMNDHLEEQDEVLVGEEGTITLNDYFDATYHLIEGAHIKFFNKSVQLKKGKTWIESLNSKHPLVITTANGHIDFWKGEFITFFDPATSKTQVLVVNGEVEISHVLDKNMKYTVNAGSFSLIDPEVENGIPRAPTKVGLNSLNSAMAEFKALPEKLQDKATVPPVRAIASVGPVVKDLKKGEIIFLKNGKSTDRQPASASAHNYYKKKVSTMMGKGSGTPIRFYGFAPATVAVKKEVPRNPASIIPKKVVIDAPKKASPVTIIDTEFSQSLRMEQASQPKHTKELDSLIHDLKSY
jgi:hypothetical protein